MSRGHYAEVYELLSTGVLPDAKVWERICLNQQADSGRSRHWEFVAIAVLHRFDETGRLAPDICARLDATRSFWHAKHESMNFRLMRSVLEARIDGRSVKANDLNSIGLVAHSDGSMPDGREGVSTQYHAYMLLLLLRWGDRQDTSLRRIIENGVAWLHAIWRRYGDPNPLGRGRFQLFGYAALAAACEWTQCWGLAHPDGYVAHIHDRLDPEQPNGALSERWTGPFRDALLHGYNTPDDYRAFVNFWTAGILRRTATVIPEVLVRHPLDFSNGCIIATGSGPLVAFTAPPLVPPEDRGRKQVLREAFHNILRKPRFAENLLPEPLTDRGFLIGDMLIHCDGKTLTIEAPYAPFRQSPVIWTLEGTPAPETEGTMEPAVWSWSRSNARTWCGHTFRIFGRARLRWML